MARLKFPFLNCLDRLLSQSILLTFDKIYLSGNAILTDQNFQGDDALLPMRYGRIRKFGARTINTCRIRTHRGTRREPVLRVIFHERLCKTSVHLICEWNYNRQIANLISTFGLGCRDRDFQPFSVCWGQLANYESLRIELAGQPQGDFRIADDIGGNAILFDNGPNLCAIDDVKFSTRLREAAAEAIG